MAKPKGYFSAKLRQISMKIVRQGGTPEYIAGGVALGLFIGFLIPMGLQLIIVLPLAFLFRVSKVMAAAFTFVTNHLTIFIIYPVQCFVGSYLIFNPLSMRQIHEQLREFISGGEASVLWEIGMELLLSFFAGGLLFGLIAAVIGYKMTLSLIHAYRKKRSERKGLPGKKMLGKVLEKVHLPHKK